jgi:hypothetical protein
VRSGSHPIPTGKHASTLLLALIAVFVLTTLGISLLGQSEGGLIQVRRQSLYNRAYYLAESGLQEGLDRLWRGPLPESGELTITDLDPPNSILVRFLRSDSGALNQLEAIASVQGLNVTLSARADFSGLVHFMRGRP